MPIAQDRDLSTLERTLKYTWVIETYVRFLLTELWLFYWPTAVLAAAVLVATPGLFIASRLGTGGLIAVDDLKTLLLVDVDVLTGLLFSVVLIKAVAQYSKPWAWVAFLLGCYVLYDNTGVFRTAISIYPRLPNAAMHLLLAAALRLTLQCGLIVCLWHIARMEPGDAALWSPVEVLHLFPRRALRRSTAIPPAIDLLKKDRFLTVLLILLGTSFFVAIPYNLDRALGDAVSELTNTESDCRAKIDVRTCLQDATTSSFHTFAFGMPVAIAFCFLAGRWILSKGRKRITWSLEDMTRFDTRSPILFLRPFREDGVRFRRPPAWPIAKFLGLGQPAVTLDEIVLEEGSPYGPVVALGSEQDKLPPYGAARGYFDNKTWQQAVIDLSEQSRAVIVYLDRTEGLQWELRHLATRTYRDRCLFLVPAKYSSRNHNADIVAYVLEILAAGDAVPDGEAPVIGFFFDRGGIVFARSRSFASSSYVAMSRWFLRFKLGCLVPDTRVKTSGTAVIIQ